MGVRISDWSHNTPQKYTSKVAFPRRRFGSLLAGRYRPGAEEKNKCEGDDRFSRRTTHVSPTNNMTTTYFPSESSPRQMLETAPGVAKPLAAMPLKVQPRPLSRLPEAASLPDLLRNLSPGHRSEDIAWMVLASSALVLLVLSLWL